MNCQELRASLHPYLDKELDLARSIEMDEHLRRCGECAQAYQQQQRLRTVMTERLRYFEAPKRLQKNIRAAVGAQVQPGASPFQWLWGWLNYRTAFAAVTLALFVCLALLLLPAARNTLPQQLVVAQIRSLMPGHLIDVASTDQHTVKPWFNGKLDFSPPVVELTAEGFPLVGGRLDYVNNRPVAVAVYQRRKHYINLFIWPSSEASGRAGNVLTRQGYHMLHWTDGGMSFWAVSDVNPAELQQFAQHFQHPESVPAIPSNSSAPANP